MLCCHLIFWMEGIDKSSEWINKVFQNIIIIRCNIISGVQLGIVISNPVKKQRLSTKER